MRDKLTIQRQQELARLFHQIESQEVQLSEKEILAKGWIRDGLDHLSRNSLIDAVLCFETAQILDPQAFQKSARVQKELIATGRLQDIYVIVYNAGMNDGWGLCEPWAQS